MKKVLEEFGGAIILYVVIFIGVVAISSRMTYINNNTTSNNVHVAINK